MTADAFDARHAALLDALARGVCPEDAAWTAPTLPGNRPPWMNTSIDVRAGDAITLLASGRVFLIEALGLWGPARFHLGGRVGERGPIWNGTRDTSTHVAPHDGRLQLAIYQGEWATHDGELAT